MADDSDVKGHALNSSLDFYELLGITPVASLSEIKRAYRQTALKYHPDKVGADAAKLEKFHLLQIAIDVLTDDTARQVYDNARRARDEKREREKAYEGRRKHLKDELERRESTGFAGLKRKRDEEQEEAAFQRELKRLAADGARRRKEREEQLRSEAEQADREHHTAKEAHTSSSVNNETPGPDDIDRTVKLRYPADTPETSQIDVEAITSRFSQFGKIDHVILKSKKLKDDGQKHRREYVVAFIMFSSIVGAHAAIMDFPALAAAERNGDHIKVWSLFQHVYWASGKEPECIPKPRSMPVQDDSLESKFESPSGEIRSQPTTPLAQRTGDGLRKVPSFGSFKGTPKSAASPSLEELTLIRLKNAERKRLAEKIKKEEEAADELLHCGSTLS